MMPIVFATDDAYILPTSVAICSLVKNTASKLINIYILVAEELSVSGKECFDLLQQKYTNCKIHYVVVGMDKFDAENLTINRISIATMFRLLLPQIFPDEMFCLYFDSDIIFKGDIAEFQRIEIADSCVAGVKDDELTPIEKHMQMIDTKIMSKYINAGVMLLNLKSIREKQLDQKLLEESKKKYPFQDQDIINTVLYPDIKLLPNKFNCFNRLSERPEDCIVLHMSGGAEVQPWLNRRCKDANLWWKYAELFENTKVYHKAVQQAGEYEKGWSLSYIYERCVSVDQVYIWGFTGKSCNLYNALRSKGLTTRCTFIDNRKEKQHYTYRGVSVVSSDSIDTKGNMLIINGVQNRRKEINLLLSEMNIDAENVIQYMEKTDFYYRVLDSKYLKEEMAEKMLLDYGIVADW